eukprot:COSAG04_NODE_2950_length_3355_cov_3.684582_6_plen_33_part_01
MTEKLEQLENKRRTDVSKQEITKRQIEEAQHKL